MLKTFQWVAFLICIGFARTQQCPAMFLRFSDHHSFCLPPSDCDIRDSTIPDGEVRQQILDKHNMYRSKVATGQETRAGGLSPASNMLQMVWDDTLADVALAWAEQCIYEHDCKPCKAVPDYSVGQNIGYQQWSCKGNPGCDLSDSHAADEPNWDSAIQAFIDEVDLYDKDNNENFKYVDDYGHFSQVVWANTWRIGCGYVVYFTDDRQVLREYYVCNYGPSGNVDDGTMYEEGEPCSACPSNSECTDDDGTMPGLCNMLDPTEAPIYPVDLPDNRFYCDFREGEDDCQFSGVLGVNKWTEYNSVGGNYISAQLNGGESTTLQFAQSFTPQESTFCLSFYLRKSAAVAGNDDVSTLQVQFDITGVSSYPPLNIGWTSVTFGRYNLDASWGMESKISFVFSVPDGAEPHILDIRTVEMYDGKCHK